MTAQTSDRILKCYRIGDPAGAYPIYDPTGSTINPGRWNTASSPIIYTSEHYSTAVLEKLIHGSGVMPPNQHHIEIILPPQISYESVNAHDPTMRGWDDLTPIVSKVYGDAWYHSCRSLLLFVPSVVARFDENILINPSHPEFPLIASRGTISRHRPVPWDVRLYGHTVAP